MGFPTDNFFAGINPKGTSINPSERINRGVDPSKISNNGLGQNVLLDPYQSTSLNFTDAVPPTNAYPIGQAQATNAPGQGVLAPGKAVGDTGANTGSDRPRSF